jgi:zona occludens toxin (predicted ATPase)
LKDVLSEVLHPVRSRKSLWTRRAAFVLCDLTDRLFAELWRRAAAPMLAEYERGTRPSPVWQDFINHSLAAPDRSSMR